MTDTFKELSRDAFLIKGFLDQASCEAQIARLEAIGFEAATFGGEGGERVNAVRNNDRIMEDDAALTTSLWERLVSALPEAWTTRQMMRRHALGAHRLIGLNARIRWYRYREGQRFHPHVDRPFIDADARQVSCHTVLIYLNTPAHHGGATKLHLDRKTTLDIHPRQGLLLCFDHHLMHEGMPLVRDEQKYVLRTDLMWAKT